MTFFKDSRHVYCPYLQKAEHVYQVLTPNEFINKSVYTVIFHLTCDGDPSIPFDLKNQIKLGKIVFVFKR